MYLKKECSLQVRFMNSVETFMFSPQIEKIVLIFILTVGGGGANNLLHIL